MISSLEAFAPWLRSGFRLCIARNSLNNNRDQWSDQSIWDQLNKQNLLPDSFIKQQKIKASIKALACNFLDFDDRQLNVDHKRIKILKNLHQKYAILSPDKEMRLSIMHGRTFR